MLKKYKKIYNKCIRKIQAHYNKNEVEDVNRKGNLGGQ